MRKLLDLVAVLGRPKILVVGDAILDRYVWGKVSRISPEAPIQVLEAGREETRPGGAANVALNLRTLGSRVVLGGTVGNDPWGQALIRRLRKEGIDTRGIIRDPAKPTTVKTRMMAHNHQLLRVDQESVEPIRGAIEKGLAKRVALLARSSDLVVASDYHKGTLVPEVCRAMIRSGKPVLVGLKSRESAKYAGATGAALNRQELRIISRTPDLDRGARSLMARLRARFLVVTLGEEGLALYWKGGKLRMGTEARAVFDVTGAGDTFLAAFAAAYASRWTLEDCARLGNVAAGIVVGKVGTAVASRQEIAAHELGRSRAGAEGPRSADEKILPPDLLLKRLRAERHAGHRIVFTNGCFDLLHVGHASLLEFARSQGDVLVVGINSDASVRRLKGVSRPVVREDERAKLVASLEPVDYVVVFREDTPQALIERIRPDVLVKGRDWAAKGVVGADGVLKSGGRVALAPLVRGSSTSGIVRRILEQGTKRG